MEVPALCRSRAARRTGSCLCAFKRRKPFLASIMAAAVQRIAMDGERQCLTLRMRGCRSYVRASDWGLLGIVGRIDSKMTFGRGTLNQWSALLTVALDHQANVASLDEQRLKVERSYDRERGLVEDIRLSEQRYAGLSVTMDASARPFGHARCSSFTAWLPGRSGRNVRSQSPDPTV